MTGAGLLHDVIGAALGDRGRWQHLIRHDRDDRVCELLQLSDDVELWLVCWADGHDTGFHDHDHSAALIAVVSGAIREERLVLLDTPISATHEQGTWVTVPSGDIHRVTHAAGRPAVTLHAYSPPLQRVGTYVVADDGRLRRNVAPADTVLGAETASASGISSLS
jgi:predicted metal-dependent enzyme (double-stranded beta helix superfamily)